MADQKKDVFYPVLGMKESERQAKLAELRNNPNRQPADDQELDRLLNLPADVVKEEVKVSKAKPKTTKKSQSKGSKKKVSKPVKKSGTRTTKQIKNV